MLLNLKIVEPGWDGYTGPIGLVEFVDAKTIHPVTQIMADRVAAVVRTEIIDDEGNTLGGAGYGARHPAGQTIAAPVEKLDVQTPEQAEAERKAAVERELKNPTAKIYTAAELEEIASKGGIAKLRTEVGDRWGVKERSIAKLITLILTAQSAYQARVAEREGAERRQREQAEAESLKIQAAKEAEFNEQCILFTEKAVIESGAIDPAKVPTNEWEGATDPNQDPDGVAKAAQAEGA